nr:unnamed protein product [Digitaria exilis]
MRPHVLSWPSIRASISCWSTSLSFPSLSPRNRVDSQVPSLRRIAFPGSSLVSTPPPGSSLVSTLHACSASLHAPASHRCPRRCSQPLSPSMAPCCRSAAIDLSVPELGKAQEVVVDLSSTHFDCSLKFQKRHCYWSFQKFRPSDFVFDLVKVLC